MLATYLTGLAVIAVVMAGWLAVQLAWRRTCGKPSGDCDVLAGRVGCHGCDGCERDEKQAEEDGT